MSDSVVCFADFTLAAVATPEPADTLCWLPHSVDLPHMVIQGTLRTLWHDVLPHTAARPTIWLAAMAIHNTLRSATAATTTTTTVVSPTASSTISTTPMSLAASAVALLWACVVLSSSLISIDAHRAVVTHGAAPNRTHVFVAALLAQYGGVVPRPPSWAAAALAALPSDACVNALCVATYFPEHFRDVCPSTAVEAILAHAADFDGLVRAVDDAAAVAVLQRVSHDAAATT